MLKQPIQENWTVRPVGDESQVPTQLRNQTIPAKVPGCIHTDLLRAGKIEDPYVDLNEFKTRWIGQTDWEYRTTFEADAKLFDHERIDLVCDGLDTIAKIELNGQEIARTQNMHRGYRFDVKDRLRLRGPNELKITFASPVKYAEEMHKKHPRPYVNGPGGPFNAIRKMACNFGWDWGPALPTCGIWRGIRLEAWNFVRIVSVRPSVVGKLDRRLTKVRFICDVEYAGNMPEPAVYPKSPLAHASLQIFHEGQDPSDNAKAERDLWIGNFEGTQIVIDADVRNAKAWWPRGHGEQPLRDYRLTVRRRDDLIGHEFNGRLGIRTIELDTTPDETGSKFILKVNNKPIFAKGFNWIPDDCFLDRACEPKRVRERIQQAVDAGGNMLRVWGGGIFETDDFYNICDEMGVLVWQDFLFACAMYAEEEPYTSEVEAEARYNVARLAHHPSLAIWNGCNENIWAYRDWGWKDHADVKGKTWGTGFYFDLLPKICKELTPTIPYWAGSPWSGDYDVDNGIHPNAATHGNKHVWEAWFKEDYGAYRKFAPRFCSEFGFQGPAPYSSIAAVVPEDKRDFGSLEMRHRQKSGDPVRDDGDRRNLKHLIKHFDLPGAQELLDSLPLDKDGVIPECGAGPLLPSSSLPSKANFDDLHYLLSVNQARALTLGVEWFRSRQPTCMGTLYWQLNDCWPGGTTWSCIDGNAKPKLLWYATRKFFADFLWTIQPEPDGSLNLCVINDTDKEFNAFAQIAKMKFDGTVLAQQSTPIKAAPRAVIQIPIATELATATDPTTELIVAGNKQHQATWFFKPDRELHYPKSEFDADWTDGHLTIRAKSLIRDLCIFVDRLDADATIDDQLITLLPRQSVTFHIESKQKLTQKSLTSSPVLRCVNDFGAVRQS